MSSATIESDTVLARSLRSMAEATERRVPAMWTTAGAVCASLMVAGAVLAVLAAGAAVAAVACAASCAIAPCAARTAITVATARAQRVG